MYKTRNMKTNVFNKHKKIECYIINLTGLERQIISFRDKHLNVIAKNMLTKSLINVVVFIELLINLLVPIKSLPYAYLF